MTKPEQAIKMTAQTTLSEPEYAGVLSPENVDNLKKSNKELECLLSSLTTILIGLSPQIQVTRWNAIAENVFGVASTQITGQSLADSGIEWDWSKIEHGISLCLRECDSVRVDDIGFVQPNGKQGYLGFTISPIRSDSGELIGFIIIGADITNRKALEDTLAQTEKLKSIGQLAAGIAHEINTPTQYVGDNTRFLQDAFQDIIQVLISYAALFKAVKTDDVSADLIEKVEEDIEESDVK
jgi:PAS domain S-box-containing protein